MMYLPTIANELPPYLSRQLPHLLVRCSHLTHESRHVPSVPLGSTIVPGRLTQKRDPVFRLKVIGNVSGNWRGGWRRGMCHMWDALGVAHSSLFLCHAPLRVSPNFSLLFVSRVA